MMKSLLRASKAVALAIVILFAVALPSRAQNDGASVYKTKCAICHGADGKGDTGMVKSMKLRDLGSADVQKQTDDELIAITTNGKGKMPAYKGKLTDAQIKDVVAFIRTFKK